MNIWGKNEHWILFLGEICIILSFFPFYLPLPPSSTPFISPVHSFPLAIPPPPLGGGGGIFWKDSGYGSIFCTRLRIFLNFLSPHREIGNMICLRQSFKVTAIENISLKRHYFLHAYATCPEIPSNMSTMRRPADMRNVAYIYIYSRPQNTSFDPSQNKCSLYIILCYYTTWLNLLKLLKQCCGSESAPI